MTKGLIWMSVLFCSLVPQAVEAGNLTSPFELEQTNLLPKGVRNPRFKNIFLGLENKYNPQGAQLPLAAAANKMVTWRDVISAQPTPTDRALIEGTLNAAGIPIESSPGSTTAVANANVNVMVPVLAWGVSKKLTLAAAVPVYSVGVAGDTGFISNSWGQQFVNAAASNSVMNANKAADKLNDAINQKLRSYGYEQVESGKYIGNENFSSVGDVKLVGKYGVFAEGKNRIALKGIVTLPTGIAPNADKAVDIPTGDGQMDVGLNLIWDHALNRLFRLNVNGGYNVQLPDHLDRRIPTERLSAVSPDKENLYRNSGDQFNVGTSMTVGSLTRGFSFGVGYNFQHMAATTYEGSAFSQERYGWLEELTPSQTLHSATVSAGFGTIDWFKEKKFFYPFQTFVTYSRTLGGENAIAGDVVSAELVMFF